MPVAVLLASWSLGVAAPSLKTLGNVSFIVIGVIIASIGEIKFVLTGFLYQAGGITFEATRLVLVQRLLSSAEFKMDPLVSLYYFAPICAVMNGLAALVLEVPSMTMKNVYDVGIFMLVTNAFVAFMLNVSVVFLVSRDVDGPSRTPADVVWADRQDVVARPDTLWHPQGHPPRGRLHVDLGHSREQDTILRLRHRPLRFVVLQARRRPDQAVLQPGRTIVV